jgi:hypothetical protein
LQNKDNFDQANSNSEWKDQNEEEMQKSLVLLRRDSVQDLFDEYYFDDAVAAGASQYFSNLTNSSRNVSNGGVTTVK